MAIGAVAITGAARNDLGVVVIGLEPGRQSPAGLFSRLDFDGEVRSMWPDEPLPASPHFS